MLLNHDFNSNFAKIQARVFKTIAPVDPDVFYLCYCFEALRVNISEVTIKIGFP